jgi:hypothetical protein
MEITKLMVKDWRYCLRMEKDLQMVRVKRMRCLKATRKQTQPKARQTEKVKHSDLRKRYRNSKGSRTQTD